MRAAWASFSQPAVWSPAAYAWTERVAGSQGSSGETWPLRGSVGSRVQRLSLLPLHFRLWRYSLLAILPSPAERERPASALSAAGWLLRGALARLAERGWATALGAGGPGVRNLPGVDTGLPGWAPARMWGAGAGAEGGRSPALPRAAHLDRSPCLFPAGVVPCCAPHLVGGVR